MKEKWYWPLKPGVYEAKDKAISTIEKAFDDLKEKIDDIGEDKGAIWNETAEILVKGTTIEIGDFVNSGDDEEIIDIEIWLHIASDAFDCDWPETPFPNVFLGGLLKRYVEHHKPDTEIVVNLLRHIADEIEAEGAKD